MNGKVLLFCTILLGITSIWNFGTRKKEIESHQTDRANMRAKSKSLMQKIEPLQFHSREQFPATTFDEQNKDVEKNAVQPPTELNGSKIAETLESIWHHETERAVVGNLIRQWTVIDYASAFAWASARSAGHGRDLLFQHISFVRAQIDPAEAAKLVVEQITPGPTQAEAAMTVLHQWALKDFKAASAWVDQFPEDLLRIRAIKELQGIQQSTLDL